MHTEQIEAAGDFEVNELLNIAVDAGRQSVLDETIAGQIQAERIGKTKNYIHAAIRISARRKDIFIGV